MSGLQYYVLDVETTGLKNSYHEITEIGIIRVIDRVQLWRQIKCSHPERASLDALRITKKSLNDLNHGFDRESVLLECEEFFNKDNTSPSHRVIIGHNIAFDRKFLHAMWNEFRKQFPANLWLDTIAMTKDFAKKQSIIKPKVNLHAACDLVGVKKLSEAHNAKVDSRNTYLLHKALMEKNINHLPFIKTSIHKINEEDDLELLNE